MFTSINNSFNIFYDGEGNDYIICCCRLSIELANVIITIFYFISCVNVNPYL